MTDESSDDSMMLSNRLGQAIINGELERVRMYIDQGVDVYTCRKYSSDIYGEMHPLALACLHGHEEIMEELLTAGADPNQVTVERHRPAMFRAAERFVLTLSMMRCLISYGADVNFRDEHGRTILYYLARGQFRDTVDNFHSAVKLLLDNGASFYARCIDDRTPLYVACAYGNIDLVKLFIAEGADVNFDIGHMAMLRGAAGSCNIDMFDLLLNAGANRRLTPDALITPCSKNNHAMLARILNTCDVDMNMSLDRYEAMTILTDACKDCFVTSETVRLLLDRGADVRAVTDTGNTALHYAAKNCDCNKIRHHLSYNPPLNIKNNENQTPLARLAMTLIPSLAD